jgi:peptide/nickel transport system substrate-binding protein
MRKRLFMAALLAAAIPVMCAGAVSAKEMEIPEARAGRMERGELAAAIGEEPEEGFDSATGGHGSLTRLIFSTLFRRDKGLGWEGDLATGYEVSEDKLTWTVTIRDDAYFTDGTPVTAQDVAFTYSSAKDSGGDIDLTMIDHIDVIDDHTVAFTLTRVYSPFMERLSYLGIIPEHAYSENFKDYPVGSGPYVLAQWDKGQQIICTANEAYYGEQPQIRQLTVVFMDTDTAFAAVESGAIDVAQINGTLAQKEVAGAQVIDIPSIECYGVCFPMVPAEGKRAEDGELMGNDVTSDIAIRKAMNAAVDRQRIVDCVLGGYGSVSTTGLEKMPWLNEDTVLKEDEYANPELARSILEEGGWSDSDGDGVLDKDGVKAEFDLLYTDGRYRQEMALEFVNVAKELGIVVNLEKVTWDTILPKIHTSAVFYGFCSGDPSELFSLYYGGNAGGPVPWDNGGVYANPECDAQIDQALEAMDEEEALPYWKGCQEYASARGDAPYCWLVNANHVFLAADGFSFGNPVIQPHGGRIFDNVTEWNWE